MKVFKTFLLGPIVELKSNLLSKEQQNNCACCLPYNLHCPKVPQISFQDRTFKKVCIRKGF